MAFRIFPLDDKPFWGISAGYFSAKLNAVARRVPGLTFQKYPDNCFVGYIDAVEQAAKMLVDLGLIVDMSQIPDPTDYRHNLLVAEKHLRDYQKTGVNFLISCGNSGAILADDMGLGKTMQSLTAARAHRVKTLVVCPRHVRDVWDRGPSPADERGGEVCRWWPEAFKNIERLDGVKPRKLNPDALIAVTHYDVVHAWADALREWGVKTVILDEAHVLLNPKSRRSAAIRSLDTADRRYALTGTPPTDKIKDLWSVIEIISPGRFGEFFGYGRRYCDGKQVDIRMAGGVVEAHWDFSGSSNLPELRDRLRWFCLRRTKREVMKELPPITRQLVPVSVPTSANIIVRPDNILKDKGGQLRRALDLAADGKLVSAMDLIRGHLEAGHKVIAFTYRRAVCEMVSETLGQPIGSGKKETAPPWEVRFIHGGVTHSKRGKRIDDLRRCAGPALLVANIDCASTGIDLTFADVVVFVELVWEPRELAQAESRAHRFGQKGNVFVQYVIARGTVDDLIVRGVIRKLGHQRDIVGKQDDKLSEDLQGGEESNRSVLNRLAAELVKMYEEEKRGAQ